MLRENEIVINTFENERNAEEYRRNLMKHRAIWTTMLVTGNIRYEDFNNSGPLYYRRAIIT